MSVRRHRFVPKIDDPLERRVVLSRVAPFKSSGVVSHHVPLAQAVAVMYGTQTHPNGWATTQGTSHVTIYNQSGPPNRHKLVFTVKPIHLPQPDLAKVKESQPNLNAFELTYRNEGIKPLVSGTILVKLDRGFRFLPGSEVVPPGSTFTATFDSNHIETLNLTFMTSVPAGAVGHVQFLTRYHDPNIQ